MMPNRLLPDLRDYIAHRLAELENLSDGRRTKLDRLAGYWARSLQQQDHARLLFVCTHNSRRSHFAQIWAQVAALWFGLDRTATYSGGTESTALHDHTAASLQRAGFDLQTISNGSNPVREIRYSQVIPPVIGFSKTIDHPANPTGEFGAVMTCAEADADCPFVPGAEFRLALPFEDPKSADGSPEQDRTYDRRQAQIARQMLYTAKVTAEIMGAEAEKGDEEDAAPLNDDALLS